MKPTLASIEAAKKLIEKYESLTLKDVIGGTPQTITGFGHKETCILCKVSDLYCHGCIYTKKETTHLCYHEESAETFNAVASADSPEALLKAYYNRAQYIRKVLKDIEEREKKFTPIVITIDLTTREEAQALHAVMSYYHNWELLGPHIANNVCDQLKQYQTDDSVKNIANGISYENFFKPKIQ